MTATEEINTSASPRLWIAIVITAFILSYLLGYVVSAKTGVEPGFFDKPEAGGYGAGTEASVAPGLDKDLQDHYSDLAE
ncbi:MAG: hypothetical protein P8Y28_14735 [Gammaproteobacteria bacterium]|jgi:hypothetical protein